MAYSTNPNLPKARATALKLLMIERLPLQVVANKCGVHRTTIWRWRRKWDEVNPHAELKNYGRPSRAMGRKFRLESCKWSIKTGSSRPHHHPHAFGDDVVAGIRRLTAGATLDS